MVVYAWVRISTCCQEGFDEERGAFQRGEYERGCILAAPASRIGAGIEKNLN